ncbi:GAF domain-containing protein [Amycolatopsis pretoriensis]|uniref:GAF domain-containing protein n=1 Tax=Amycolatopsis pretoriensis TaxID=218821 RepID=A0A1H5RIR6_9PSEU|nr:GAF domain-containing protein [Amycolatopsis pretoriensis]SEF37417.1 GAF domain-containing protein [Amycolatopsis pretoriensis]
MPEPQHTGTLPGTRSGVRTLAWRGELDMSAAPAIGRVSVDEDLVIDLTEATLVSAVVVRTLVRLHDDAVRRRHRLVVVTRDRFVAWSLRQADRRLTVAKTREDALARLDATASTEAVEGRRARNRARIADALDVLCERYHLATADEAFELVREASQSHNVTIRTLAAAVHAVPAPTGPGWFPGRARRVAPPTALRPAGRTPPALLTAALTASLRVTGAPHAAVHSIEPLAGGLALEHHHGLGPRYVDLFTHLDSGAACTQAQHRRERVVVPDVASSPVYTAEHREAVLRAGARAAQSTPILTPGGVCAGVLTTHHDHPADLPGVPELELVDLVCADAGRWLDWHSRTIVLDALEHLHARATSR